MNISTQLNDFQNTFLPFLENFFETHRQSIGSMWPLAKDMFEKLAELTLRKAKRTRPALLYYSYQGFSNDNPLKLMPLCIACELMQSFLLIHDDIMDHAALRRGGKTIHHQFQSHEDTQYGESMAILIGNLAGYLGLQTIGVSEFGITTKNYLMTLYAQICIDAGYGQALDITFDNLEKITEADIYMIYRYKTSRYTTEFPLLAVAALTDLQFDHIKDIEILAVDIGILFQIKDDIMGLFGDEKVMGKPLDSIYRKKTLLVYKAFEQGNAEQKRQLETIYNDKEADAHQINIAKKIISDTGSLAYAENMIDQHCVSAKKIIHSLPLNFAGKTFLSNLVDYYAERNH